MSALYFVIICLVFALWHFIIVAKMHKDNAKFWKEQSDHDFRKYINLASKMFDEDE